MARSSKVASHADYARWFASQGGKARKEALTPKERSAVARKAVLARYKTMTREERREIARKAARARWAKKAKKT
jgi:hypothetical protein